LALQELSGKRFDHFGARPLVERLDFIVVN
jgi:hypothetical protein